MAGGPRRPLLASGRAFLCFRIRRNAPLSCTVLGIWPWRAETFCTKVELNSGMIQGVCGRSLLGLPSARHGALETTMRNAADGMGEAFDEWSELTDAYGRQLQALMRQEPGAAEALSRLS